MTDFYRQTKTSGGPTTTPDVRTFVHGQRIFTRNGFQLKAVDYNRVVLRRGAVEGRVFELHSAMSQDEMQGRVNIEADEIEEAIRQNTGYYDGV